MRNWEKILTVVALISVIAAWLIGSIPRERTILGFTCYTLPQATDYSNNVNGIYEGTDLDGSLVGYIVFDDSNGYGGPMLGALGVDPDGKVVKVTIFYHSESPAFFQRVMHSGFFEHLAGKKYSDNFIVGDDIDGVTGATRSAQAIADLTRKGSRQVAAEKLDLPVPPEQLPIRFGLPEVTLIVLFAVGLALYSKRLKWKKTIRWAALIAGMITIGFLWNSQLSLSNVNALLLGYWPAWQTHIFWYLLIIGVLVIPLVIDKDPYCHAVCPFGAAQECLGAVGGAKRRVKPRTRTWLRWGPRLLAWLAIILALLYRNPAQVNYEVYGTLFAFIGTPFLLWLLCVVLVASLFVKRPWCNYLCPIRPVRDYLHFVKKWIRQSMRTAK